jgi:2-polyprenyl-3-methyl-5-hydroxy-6-metoxy-1,4-benzoquinol methylase
MFKFRSQKKELLDGIVAKKDLILNLKELHAINSILGGYNVSIHAFKQFKLQGKIIVDIGSGGGDTLNEILKYTTKNKVHSKLVGVDLKQECTDYASSHLSNELTFITDDYRNIQNHLQKIDFIHACLFTHHLTDHEITELIQFSLQNNSVLIINDLDRNPLAYYSIKLLTKYFSKSHLVKHDAPLSVLRGFKKKEWHYFLKQAGASDYSVKWKWAFRHQIIVHG